MRTPVLSQERRPGRLEPHDPSLRLCEAERRVTDPVASVPDGIPYAR